MMSSLVYGLDICVQGRDVRVSTGRCFIFVMKYIKLTYIQAGIMFFFFCCGWMSVFNPLEKMQKRWAGGWDTWGKTRLPVLAWLRQSCEEGDKVAQTWQLHRKCPYCILYYSHDEHCPVLHVSRRLKGVHANHTKNVRATLVNMYACMRRGRQCVCALTQDFSPYMRLFFTHIILTLIRKMGARSASQEHVVPAKSKVQFKEWMNEQSKSTNAWMGSLFSQALLLCWQENKSLITPPCEGAHTLCSHIPLGQMMMSAPRWPENSAALAWTWRITSLAVPVTAMNV